MRPGPYRSNAYQKEVGLVRGMDNAAAAEAADAVLLAVPYQGHADLINKRYKVRSGIRISGLGRTE
ncbi:NAD(P)-binding domain-containing protein [Streptomyces shenzhenensis]|uniref:NAD(P)-binding domain-containing protein n=1 Tax=Streptomyces shenzhenensis TaxID=943815 RepID=UPI00368F9FDA